MQTDTNIDLLSRDDSVHLGMGRLSVRNLNSSELGDDTSGAAGGKKRAGIKGRMGSKKMNNK